MTHRKLHPACVFGVMPQLWGQFGQGPPGFHSWKLPESVFTWLSKHSQGLTFVAHSDEGCRPPPPPPPPPLRPGSSRAFTNGDPFILTINKEKLLALRFVGCFGDSELKLKTLVLREELPPSFPHPAEVTLFYDRKERTLEKHKEANWGQGQINLNSTLTVH